MEGGHEDGFVTQDHRPRAPEVGAKIQGRKMVRQRGSDLAHAVIVRNDLIEAE